jgi:hypothetical protein
MIKWRRSEEGNVESKCGRYSITAHYAHTTRPSSYSAVYYPSGRPAPDYVQICRFAGTQGQAKHERERFALKIHTEKGN